MKKIFVNILSVSALATSMLTSCKKTADAVLPRTSDSEMITTFFTNNEKKPQSFTIDAGAGGIITTTAGTVITIAPNAFVDPSNAPVTGPVTVSVLDIVKPSDMILNNKPTEDNAGRALVSFGEIKVDAAKEGKPLQVVRDIEKPRIKVAMPLGIKDPAGQQRVEVPLWNGRFVDVTTTNSNTFGHNHLNQSTTATTSYTHKQFVWDTMPGIAIATPSTTTFPLDSLGPWRNCDALYSDTRPKTTLLGYFGQYYNPATTQSYGSTKNPSSLFYKAKNINTLVQLYTLILNPAAGKAGFLTYQNTMPIGSEGTFLAISALNGKYYAQMLDYTCPPPDAGKNYVGVDFNLTEVSESQLLSLIKQMNSK